MKKKVVELPKEWCKKLTANSSVECIFFEDGGYYQDYCRAHKKGLRRRKDFNVKRPAFCKETQIIIK